MPKKSSAGTSAKKSVAAYAHVKAKRKNIPTGEQQSIVQDDVRAPVALRYPRNTDLDPQLVWRGKDAQDDAGELEVKGPPLYIQEKIHPKFLIDDLRRRSAETSGELPDLFGDFNGVSADADKTDFYRHDQNWTNRMILGDSLQVMTSLAGREGLRGKVQCIYVDPPYGIKFNSNFQWSTTSANVRDGKDITREPEMVKAFRDTWRDGIHSYLSYLRDRLSVARDLLAESGSVFVQIGDENVHRVRVLMDEVFGEDNFVSMILFQTTTGAGSPAKLLNPPSVGNYLLWYAKNGKERMKYREQFRKKIYGDEGASAYKKIENDDGERMSVSQWEKDSKKTYDPEEEPNLRLYGLDNFTSQGGGENSRQPISLFGRNHTINKGSWKTSTTGIERLKKTYRLDVSSKGNIGYVRYFFDFPAMPIPNVWTDTIGQNQFGGDKIYVVQTGLTVIQRCILMTTDPGDLVLDPTCGSGTTAFVAEQWGRRWITIDTSRVALALARARLMGGRFPYYILKDTPEGQKKEAEVTGTVPSSHPTQGDIRLGFVYERVPHITLKSIANNANIDVIWDDFQTRLEPLRERLNALLKKSWREWEIPREADAAWSAEAKNVHAEWRRERIARQKKMDESISRNAEYEYLYDKPYADAKKVRVAGPFTVESVSPHRMLAMDENDEFAEPFRVAESAPKNDFTTMILENLKTAGVQQAHKEDRIEFSSLASFPGKFVCAEGRYQEGDKERRAAIFVGPEFGTVSRPDLADAAREAAECGFDVLIACAFNYDAHSTEFEKLGRVPVLKARMNADLHMAEDLKNTGKGNLFVIFGEPDIELSRENDGNVRVRVLGVDVFKPNEGRVESSGTDGIACWFVDTDYNAESFFVRQAYFLGQKNPYEALKKTLKAEIDEEAWESLNSDVSRPFPPPKSGRIAVKVINCLGDEVMKVFRV